jgi:hypothetical protein
MARSNTKKSGTSTRRSRAAAKQRPAKVKSPVTTAETTPAHVETTERHWWQRTPKSERPTYVKLPNVVMLTKSAYQLLLMNRRLILGIALWYGVLNIILVRGLNGGINVSELKTQLGSANDLSSTFSAFSYLVSSSNSGASSDASAYQMFLGLIISLALIWSFRQLLSDSHPKLRIRDSFYKGMYPLIPVLLVLLILSLQLIPMLIGATLFSAVIGNGIAISAVEVIICCLVFLALIVWSLLWITPTVFALYIVTLPDMTPLKALRSAKTIVKYRRPTVLRKLLFLPLLIFVLLGAILLPIIFVVPILAQWVYFALSILILPAVHAYLYTLYRELLSE